MSVARAGDVSWLLVLWPLTTLEPLEYSKLSMGPLFADILDHWTPVLMLKDFDGAAMERPPAKLAVYSGYDSTIMQVLSTLGPDVWDGTEWPPYASMILIEVRSSRTPSGTLAPDR